MRETLVELKLASKYYKTDTHVVEALRRISLKFERGEFVAVTGESGSGKSTLLRAICGLIPLDDGDLFLHGESCFSISSSHWFSDFCLISLYELSSCKNILFPPLKFFSIYRETAVCTIILDFLELLKCLHIFHSDFKIYLCICLQRILHTCLQSP